MKKKIISMIVLICVLVSMMAGTAFAYAEMQVTVGGVPMILNSDYDSSILPEGFYETDHTYQGETFWGGTDEATESVDIYYLRCDSDPSKTGWYTLESSGNFTKYGETSATAGLTEAQAAAAATQPVVQAGVATGDSITGNQITLQVYTLDSDADVPYGYVEASVASENSMISCYRKEDASGANADAYLIYGTVDGVSRGWYTYDMREGTIQRFMGNADSQIIQQQEDIITGLKTDLEDLNTMYNKNVGRSKNLFLIAVLIAVAALFLMINAMLKRHHVVMDLEDRIVDLKRNGGKETAHFSGSEIRKYQRLDSAAESRNYHYMDDDDDLDMGNPFADAPRKSRPKKNAPYDKDDSVISMDDSEFEEDIAAGQPSDNRRGTAGRSGASGRSGADRGRSGRESSDRGSSARGSSARGNSGRGGSSAAGSGAEYPYESRGQASGSRRSINDDIATESRRSIDDGMTTGGRRSINDGTVAGNRRSINDGTAAGNRRSINDGTVAGSRRSINDGTAAGNHRSINDGTMAEGRRSINDGTAMGNRRSINDGIESEDRRSIRGGASTGNRRSIRDGSAGDEHRREGGSVSASQGSRSRGDYSLRRGEADPTIKLPANETKRRREGLNGTRPIVDGNSTIAAEAEKRNRQNREVTIKAAGDSADFDLDALEKSLGAMTDRVMNEPDKKPRVPKLGPDDMDDAGSREYNADVFQL